MVEWYIPVPEMFQTRVDELEERHVHRESDRDRVLLEIVEMKRDTQHCRRAVLPIRTSVLRERTV